jgi:hypothetical protein
MALPRPSHWVQAMPSRALHRARDGATVGTSGQTCCPLREGPKGSRSPASSPRSTLARERMRSIDAAARGSADHSVQGTMPGPGSQARSPLARRGIHCRTDGAACAVHRGRTWGRCLSVHVAPLCRVRREGGTSDLGADASCPRRSQGARHEAGQSGRRCRSGRTPGAKRCGGPVRRCGVAPHRIATTSRRDELSRNC